MIYKFCKDATNIKKINNKVVVFKKGTTEETTF